MDSQGEVVEIGLDLKLDRPDLQAVLFTDGDEDIWIPRSQIVEMFHDHDEHYIVQVTEWIAEQKGLI